MDLKKNNRFKPQVSKLKIEGRWSLNSHPIWLSRTQVVQLMRRESLWNWFSDSLQTWKAVTLRRVITKAIVWNHLSIRACWRKRLAFVHGNSADPDVSAVRKILFFLFLHISYVSKVFSLLIYGENSRARSSTLIFFFF